MKELASILAATVLATGGAGVAGAQESLPPCQVIAMSEQLPGEWTTEQYKGLFPGVSVFFNERDKQDAARGLAQALCESMDSNKRRCTVVMETCVFIDPPEYVKE